MVSFSSLVPTLALLSYVHAVRFLGRVNPETRELTWPSTGVSFTFTGTSATIGLEAVTGSNSVELRIDDNEPIVIPNVEGTSISTPAGLSQGDHTVSLRKRSETYFGSIFIGNVTTDGVLGPDPVPERRIEIIGDSISVGYGLDGVNPCTNTAAVENNPKTYGALAAEALDADYSVIAWSGKGITRNYASNPPDDSLLVPELYTRYGANDASGSYTFPEEATPDVVVINLGTNDFSYLGVREPLDPAKYTAAMVDFIQGLQTEHYPEAEYFLLTSPLLSDTYPTAEDAQKTTQTNALNDVIAQLDSPKVHLVDWPTQGSDVGCDYHPNAATNAAEAVVLEAAIRDVTGW